MGAKKRLDPIGYTKIHLKGGASGRTHHAVIFRKGRFRNSNVKAKCMLPHILTFTPTHGMINRWRIVGREECLAGLFVDQVVLLVPRSWWVWWLVPMSKKDKADLFYLEVQEPLDP